MSLFRSLAETRQLGAPIVGLYRTALGRDPGPAELALLVPMVRSAAAWARIAERITESPEFRQRHGQTGHAALAKTLLGNAFGPQAAETHLVAAVAGLGATAAELVASVAGLALGRGAIPMLPGLAPGAPPDDPTAYQLWVREYDMPSAAELAQLARIAGQRISVAISAGDTQLEALAQTVESLLAQVYRDWELSLVARTLSPWSAEALAQIAAQDRVRLVAGSTLAHALAAASGPLRCVLQPGDRLAPSAFHEIVSAFAAQPETALLFTDEDVLEAGRRHSPRLKPDFSPEAPLVGQLAVYRAELLREIERPQAGPEFASELANRAAKTAGAGRVRHLPSVLFHAGRPPAPLTITQSQPRSPRSAPLVSVIVPTKDRAALLSRCAEGVLGQTEYGPLELMLVDNGSTEPDALALLSALSLRARVRVLSRPGPFNFASLNNTAAAEAQGEVLLLLNNDTEVLEGGWLGAMVAHALRPDVGAVGARLLYPDGTVQHAGILLGPEGSATHVGRGAKAGDPGYLGQLACTRDLSAVTGACLAIRKATWDLVGGMDERLAVAWNDIDLCLKVRAAGLRVLWTPDATLVHHESATRGLEREDPARLARFRAEQALVRTKWGEALDADPFLNPNLVATEAGPLALARPRVRRPWAEERLRMSGNHAIPTP